MAEVKKALAVDCSLGNGVSAPDGLAVCGKESNLTTCISHSNQCYILLYEMKGMRLRHI